MMIRIVLLTLTMAMGPSSSLKHDTTGSTFILGFLDSADAGTHADLELLITTSHFPASPALVNVTTPLYDPTWYTEVTVRWGDVVSVTIPPALRGSGIALENKGILVNTTGLISVYVKSATETFTVYPTHAVDTSYVAVTWDGDPEILVVGALNESTVEIQVSDMYSSSFLYDDVAYGAGDVLSFILMEHETFHLHAAEGDLTGTRITSTTGGVFVFSGNYQTEQTSAGHLAVELSANSYWGKNFISVSPPAGSVDYHCMIIAENTSASYNIGDDVFNYVVNAYEHRIHQLTSGSYHFIDGLDNNMAVVTFVTNVDLETNGAGPYMMVVPKISDYGSAYTWTTMTSQESQFSNYVVIITNAQWKNKILLDKETITAQWTTVEGIAVYVATDVAVAPGMHSIYTLDRSHTFAAFAYGNADDTSYAFFLSPNTLNLYLPCNETNMTVADGIDNDCDLIADEEIDNGVDDDSDGLIDEDIRSYAIVNGSWGTWGSWSGCNLTCDIGERMRNRSCDSPPARNGGSICTGNSTDIDSCTCAPIHNGHGLLNVSKYVTWSWLVTWSLQKLSISQAVF